MLSLTHFYVSLLLTENMKYKV